MSKYIKLSKYLLIFSSLGFACMKIQASELTCEQVGGSTVIEQNEINNGPTALKIGEPQQFCIFESQGSISTILASSLLAHTPNLAATAYRNAPNPLTLNLDKKLRPDVAYCEYLSGATKIGTAGLPGGWTANGDDGQSRICIFTDGSMISTWTLFYKRAKADIKTDLTPLFQNEEINAKLW